MLSKQRLGLSIPVILLLAFGTSFQLYSVVGDLVVSEIGQSKNTESY